MLMDKHVAQTSSPSVPHTRGTQIRDAPRSLPLKKVNAGRHINKEGSVPNVAPPPLLQKTDFLPSCLPHALRTHAPGRSPNGAESMEGQFVFGRRRCGRPPDRAPTRGFLEARAGSGRPRGPGGVRCNTGPVGAHWRARADAPTRARRVPSSLSPPAAVRVPGAALEPPPSSPRPPRTCPSGQSGCPGRP